jgi:glyoxalase family protein
MAVAFRDPDGVDLEIISDEGTPRAGSPWPDSPVPTEHQIRGVYAVRLALRNPQETVNMMINVLGFQEIGAYDRDGLQVTVLSAANGEPGRQVHIVRDDRRPRGMLGHGGTHHVAFRVTDFPTYDRFLIWLKQNGIGHSGPVDRYWFKSIYFRTVEGIVFELATDEPGFATDEPLEKLGEKLSLAPFLEPMRAQIEARLKPLN